MSGYPAGSVCSYEWVGLSAGRSLCVTTTSLFHRGLDPSTLEIERSSRHPPQKRGRDQLAVNKGRPFPRADPPRVPTNGGAAPPHFRCMGLFSPGPRPPSESWRARPPRIRSPATAGGTPGRIPPAPPRSKGRRLSFPCRTCPAHAAGHVRRRSGPPGPSRIVLVPPVRPKREQAMAMVFCSLCASIPRYAFFIA